MQTPQLSDALTDFNLHQAWSKVYENQGCAGVDHQTLESFAERLHKNLETLRDEVNYETYQPQALLRIALEKPSGGMRLLSIPTVRDRILQTAVTRVIEPLFEAEFEDCSFAYRKGRSVDQAIDRIQLLQRQGYHWVVDADIQCFFDGIDHTLLMTMIGKLIADVGLLRMARGRGGRCGVRQCPNHHPGHAVLPARTHTDLSAVRPGPLLRRHRLVQHRTGAAATRAILARQRRRILPEAGRRHGAWQNSQQPPDAATPSPAT